MSEVLEPPHRQSRGIDTTKQPEPPLSDGPISGERYYSRAFMELEWERMWTKVWQIAGLERELEKPGDFLTYEIGRESILCTKAADGKIRAFFNICQHRGNLLSHETRGNAKNLTCAYHGWRYEMDGRLAWAPCREDFPQGDPCGKANLFEIPCEVWSGFIWFNMDPDCAPLSEFLAPVKDQLECYRLGEMRRTHWVTLRGDFNWKCIQDNFNESYHLPYVHPQTKYVMEQAYQNCQFDLFPPNGHCRMFMPGCRPTMSLKGEEETVLRDMGPELELWDLDPNDFRGRMHDMRLELQKQKRKLGAAKGYDFENFNDDQLTDHYHYTLFPNLSFSMKPDGCIFLRGAPHPTDPEQCYFDMWYLTWFPKGEDKYFSHTMDEWVSLDTPVAHQIGDVGEFSCGPGIDQDVDIWRTQQKGLRSRGYRGGYLPNQERRVRFFHDTLDAYIYGRK